jgi:hypothetical protein
LNNVVQVERENNGFEARWCGNRVTQGGSRPHVIFARSEVHFKAFYADCYVTKELSYVLVKNIQTSGVHIGVRALLGINFIWFSYISLAYPNVEEGDIIYFVQMKSTCLRCA